jgi:hypothetical protein
MAAKINKQTKTLLLEKIIQDTARGQLIWKRTLNLFYFYTDKYKLSGSRWWPVLNSNGVEVARGFTLYGLVKAIKRQYKGKTFQSYQRERTEEMDKVLDMIGGK